MAAIRPVDAIASKWATVTPQRSPDYQSGVEDPKADWQAATVAANGAWKAGIQAAVQKDSFVKGVGRVGSAGWQEGALKKGVQRWGPGVAIAEDKYRAAFGPYVEAIKRVTLPPRFARRDPRNLERNKAVVDALVRVKEGRG